MESRASAGFESPAQNLAFDEALLDHSEENGGAGFLRFWESASYFVVLGYAKKLALEVELTNCENLGIPIFRRCTGGGTVLQGPGCLNYTLVLPISAREEFATITGTNCLIMKRHREVMRRLTGAAVELEGHTDLAIDGKKFSGNAQRRRRNYLLFHGCFLLNMNFELIEKTLRMPVQQPEYRQQRRHSDFLMNLCLPANVIAESVTECWNDLLPEGGRIYSNDIYQRATELSRGKYDREDWNLKF